MKWDLDIQLSPGQLTYLTKVVALCGIALPFLIPLNGMVLNDAQKLLCCCYTVLNKMSEL